MQRAAERLAYRIARLFMPAQPEARSLLLEFGVPVVDATLEANVCVSLNGKTLHLDTVQRDQMYHWSIPVVNLLQASAVMLELITEPDAVGAGHVTAKKHLCISRMEFSTQAATGCKAIQPMPRTLLPVLLKHLPPDTTFMLVLGGRVEQGLEAVGSLRQQGYAFFCFISEAHNAGYDWLQVERTSILSIEQPTIFTAMTLEQANRQTEQHQLQHAWLLQDSVLYDLKQRDHFAQQLSPAPNPVEAQLRKQLEKQQQKLQASQDKVTSIRARLEKNKASTAKQKKWWQRLL